MESDCIKKEENIYFACRKKAAETNEALGSRERAAELLGIATSTLANHELGITKNVPVDTVLMMSDLYHSPELRNMYCKNECPIGRYIPMATETDGLQGITVKILNSLDDENIRNMKKALLDIAVDGQISEDEKETFEKIVKSLDVLATAISELRMLAEKSMVKMRGR